MFDFISPLFFGEHLKGWDYYVGGKGRVPRGGVGGLKRKQSTECNQ